jgi:hypothetical protein
MLHGKRLLEDRNLKTGGGIKKFWEIYYIDLKGLRILFKLLKSSNYIRTT